jgi:cytochrome c oxidase subunit 2
LTGTAFLVVAAILGYAVVRFRERPGRRARYTHGDSRLARWLTVGFAVLIFLVIDVNLAVRDHLVWEEAWGNPPARAEALRVEIMPEQFAWNIRYAGSDGIFRTGDDVTTINQLHVPANTPVLVQLSSKDVIHSFFLPNLRIKMDAVPGMVTALYFQAQRAGTYDIACAEHCGFGHYRMRGFLVVEEHGAFESWLAAQAMEGSPDLSWGWNWDLPAAPPPASFDPEGAGAAVAQMGHTS